MLDSVMNEGRKFKQNLNEGRNKNVLFLFYKKCESVSC